jgi:hypothetical protein
VNVRRQAVRVIERAHAHETQGIAALSQTRFGAAMDTAVLGVCASVLICVGAWRFSKIEV